MAAGRKPWWEAPKAAEIQACARRISDGAPIDVAIMATWTCSDRAARRGRALGYSLPLRHVAVAAALRLKLASLRRPNVVTTRPSSRWFCVTTPLVLMTLPDRCGLAAL